MSTLQFVDLGSYSPLLLPTLWNILHFSTSREIIHFSTFTGSSSMQLFKCFIVPALNRLSGSFSTTFRNRSGLVFVAANGNFGLVTKVPPPPPQRLNVALQNWNLSVFDQCSNITYLLMQVPCYLMLCSDKLLCTGLWHRGGSQLSTLLLVTHHAPSIFIDGVLHRQTIRYQAQCHQHYYKACLGYEPSSCKITG